jgi:hypothetical protein
MARKPRVRRRKRRDPIQSRLGEFELRLTEIYSDLCVPTLLRLKLRRLADDIANLRRAVARR